MKKQDSQLNSGASDIGAYTIAELETGKDWLNVLWNDGGYQATVTHTGVTTARRVTESSELIRLNAEKSSALYVRDEDTGDYFTPGGYPCGHQQSEQPLFLKSSARPNLICRCRKRRSKVFPGYSEQYRSRGCFPYQAFSFSKRAKRLASEQSKVILRPEFSGVMVILRQPRGR